MITDNYLDSKFYCHLSGSQISIILYQLELIPQEKIIKDPELQKDLGEIFTELESKGDDCHPPYTYKGFNNDQLQRD